MENLIVLAHQFRTPLQTTESLLSLLLDEELSDAMKKKLLLIQECNAHQMTIVKKLIDLSTKKDTFDDTKNSDFQLHKSIKRCIYANENNSNKNAFILQNVNKQIYLHGNEKLLKELINNVLNTMCIYTTNGEIEVKASVQKIGTDKAKLILSFVDSKKGTDLDKKRQIFLANLYYVSKDDAFINFNIISLKQSIKNLQATLLTNIYEAFDKLIIEIPFGISKRQHDSPITPKKRIIPSLLPNILIVEDSKIIQQLLKKCLTNEGYNCQTANNGKEAIDIYRSDVFDIVLMDLMMPVMDGFESASFLKTKFDTIKIIGISAVADLFTEKKKDFDAFLTKPIQKEKLIYLIQQLI